MQPERFLADRVERGAVVYRVNAQTYSAKRDSECIGGDSRRAVVAGICCGRGMGFSVLIPGVASF